MACSQGQRVRIGMGIWRSHHTWLPGGADVCAVGGVHEGGDVPRVPGGQRWTEDEASRLAGWLALNK